MIGHDRVLHQIADDIHNAAPRPLAHLRQHGPADIERRAHSTVKLTLVVAPLQIIKTAALLRVKGVGLECVVDHHVDTARLAHDAVDHGQNFRRIAHIGFHRPGVTTCGLTCGHGLLRRRIVRQIVHHHRRALARKGQRNRRTNAATGTRHQHHLAVQTH